MKFDAPICGFVKEYNKKKPLRLHMPGHKGIGKFGFEQLDITEVAGADSLYDPRGIIARSEYQASILFHAHTFYSTEGSSHAIRAMLYLALQYGKRYGRKPLIAAGRNVHKAFVTAAALLDFDVDWLIPAKQASYLSCYITPAELEEYLREHDPVAVYITSPDYLGHMADLQGLADVCHHKGVLLLVDNAHGAYLRVMDPSQHPMDADVDMCADSAHKTLRVLTGGAYLHLRQCLPVFMKETAKHALAMFGSTSPSYLTLQSLDRMNRQILVGYPQEVWTCADRVTRLKRRLMKKGYTIIGEEPMKLTVDGTQLGYSGYELAYILRDNNIEPEFADPDVLTLMFTPNISFQEIRKVSAVLMGVKKREPLEHYLPPFALPEKRMTIREAAFSLGERIPVEEAEGRVLQAVTVGCPPAVPILMCGEVIGKREIELFRYYGITHCVVVKDVLAEQKQV